MKKFCKYLFSTITVVLTLAILQALVVPKYVEDIPEGSMMAEYYDETTTHDVVFIGDCEVYENYSPLTLWEEYGINSYIRGTSQQCIWQSYAVLEDTLKYETPKAVVFNVLSMRFDTPQSEAYNRLTLDGMRWSETKVDAINASMTKEESFVSYVFPLLRYHERITELTEEDTKYFFKKPKVSHNGYYMRVEVRPAEYVPTGKPLGDYNFGDTAWEYLEKIRLLCEEKGVELILVKAPSVYPYWYPEWNENIVNYAKEHGLSYYNFLEKAEEIGIDYNLDTYDQGLHMNLTGAEKLSRYFGEILVKEHGMVDHRGDATLDKLWENKASFYQSDVEKKKRLWEEEKQGEEIK